MPKARATPPRLRGSLSAWVLPLRRANAQTSAVMHAVSPSHASEMPRDDPAAFCP